MCGMFGWSIPQGPEAPTDFQLGTLALELARRNDERGGHSWGVWSPTTTIKPIRGIGSLASNAYVIGYFGRTVCAHTRFATQGEVTVENAHPFEMSHIVGAHNGIVYNHAELHPDFPVDSMHLIHRIAMNATFMDIKAYGALQWTEKDKNDIYLSRLRNGEMSVVSVLGGGLIWSSDEDDLYAACEIAGLLIDSLYELAYGEVVRIVDGQIYDTEQTIEVAPHVSTNIIRSEVLDEDPSVLEYGQRWDNDVFLDNMRDVWDMQTDL